MCQQPLNNTINPLVPGQTILVKWINEQRWQAAYLFSAKILAKESCLNLEKVSTI